MGFAINGMNMDFFRMSGSNIFAEYLMRFVVKCRGLNTYIVVVPDGAEWKFRG